MFTVSDLWMRCWENVKSDAIFISRSLTHYVFSLQRTLPHETSILSSNFIELYQTPIKTPQKLCWEQTLGLLPPFPVLQYNLTSCNEVLSLEDKIPDILPQCCNLLQDFQGHNCWPTPKTSKHTTAGPPPWLLRAQLLTHLHDFKRKTPVCLISNFTISAVIAVPIKVVKKAGKTPWILAWRAWLKA